MKRLPLLALALVLALAACGADVSAPYSASPACVASAPNRSGRSIGVIIAPNPPEDFPAIARDSRSGRVR